MGFAKEQWLKAMEGGYTSVPDKHVCGRCITDPVLACSLFPSAGAQEEDNESDEVCSYCGGRGTVCVDDVVEEVSAVILAEYTDPTHELPYESAEGGYQGHVQDGFDIVLYELDPWTENDELAEDVAGAFSGSSWCKRHYFSMSQLDGLSYGWKSFVGQVKYVTRYLFLQELEEDEFADSETVPPGGMLDTVGELLRAHLGPVVLPAGESVFRVRIHDPDCAPTDVSGLGSPPRDKASMSNRMSPAGISMFYGALEPTTAVLETFDPARGDDKRITVATFAPVRDLRLLDFTRLPEMPSQFDGERYHLRMPLAFLYDFVRELGQPVARDGMEHVDYVPTQIVTEYVRHRYKTLEEEVIDGIMYQSAKDGEGTSLVIFADEFACGPRPERQAWESEVLLDLVEYKAHEPSEFASLWGRTIPTGISHDG